MFSDDEREAIIRSLRDAGYRIGRTAALVKTREADPNTVALLESAVLDIERAIRRLTLHKAQST